MKYIKLFFTLILAVGMTTSLKTSDKEMKKDTDDNNMDKLNKAIEIAAIGGTVAILAKHNQLPKFPSARNLAADTAKTISNTARGWWNRMRNGIYNKAAQSFDFITKYQNKLLNNPPTANQLKKIGALAILGTGLSYGAYRLYNRYKFNQEEEKKNQSPSQ